MKGIKYLNLQVNPKIHEKLENHLHFSGLSKNQYIALLILDADEILKKSPSYIRSLKEKCIVENI